MKLSRLVIGAGLSLALASGSAWAQARPAAAPAAAAPSAPGQPEVKTIGSWLVRCFPIASASPCDMYEELANKDTHQRVLSLSIAFVPSLNRHALQITVPLSVDLQKGVVIKADNYTSPVLKYRQCDRQSCMVQMAIDDATIAALSRSGEKGTVRIVIFNGKPFDIGISLKGFAAAHDSMVEQAKAKAKTPPPAPANAAAPAP
jgi:invasion protein IalB